MFANLIAECRSLFEGVSTDVMARQHGQVMGTRGAAERHRDYGLGKSKYGAVPPPGEGETWRATGRRVDPTGKGKATQASVQRNLGGAELRQQARGSDLKIHRAIRGRRKFR